VRLIQSYALEIVRLDAFSFSLLVLNCIYLHCSVINVSLYTVTVSSYGSYDKLLELVLGEHAEEPGSEIP
jgi:hypothetical protein